MCALNGDVIFSRFAPVSWSSAEKNETAFKSVFFSCILQTKLIMCCGHTQLWYFQLMAEKHYILVHVL